MTTAAVDLGRTNLRAGYLGPDGFTLVPAADGTDAVPAAVWLAAPGDARAGELAAGGPSGEVITTVRADLLADPRATASERYFHGRFESPVAVAGYLLRDVARRTALASRGDVTAVILGRPVTVDDSVPLRRAAASARLTVAGIIAEPVAVALHYGAVADGVDHVTVVADAGGTAMDATVLRIRDRVVTIAASARRPAADVADRRAALTELVRQAMAEAGDGPGQRPDSVLLAGGASRAPAVAGALTDQLGLHVRISQPEAAVVRGLALWAEFGPLYVTGLGGDAVSPPVPPPSRAVSFPAPPRAADPPVADPLPRVAAPGAAAGAGGPHPVDPLPSPADPLPRAAAAGRPATVSSAAPAAAPSPPERPAAPPPPPPPPPPPRSSRSARTAPGPPRPGKRTVRGGTGEVPVGGAPDAAALMGRPVERLKALRRGDRVLLTWDWPPGSAEARVRWVARDDRPGQHGSARCTRRLYNHEGGFEIPAGRDGVMITVEALGYGAEFDDTPPSALHVEPATPAVTYEPDVRGWRKWTATVTFVSQVDCRLPSVLAVLGTGVYKPESTRDGTVVQVIPAQPLSAGEPTVVTFELTPQHGTCWLVCLPADDDTEAPVALRPASLHRLRVRG